jgi:hypothetical protein
MTRALLSLSILVMTACDAKAPPVKEQAYIVRIAYIADMPVKAYESEKRCEVTKRFVEKELPPLDGYQLVVRCIQIGE